MATKFITVSIEIMHDKNLNQSQKFLLAEIEQLSQLDNGCYASNKHFSDLIGITKENVSRNINELQRMGYIEVEIKAGSRNYTRIITLTKTVRPPYQNSKTPLLKQQETKENIQSKKQDIVFSDFKDKFDFINEESFSMLVSHLKAKYGNVTKVRIINNIKKLKDNPSLFIKAVEKMIELDYSGLFVPSSQDKKIKVQDSAYSPKHQMHNGKKRADL